MILAQNSKVITCSSEQMLNGTCEFRYNKLIGIKEDLSEEEANDPNLFVADIFLSATFFIGTLAFLGIIISGLKMIFQGGTDPKKSADAMKGIKNSLIALIIVIFSYTIIRLIQYFVGGRI